MYHPEQAMELGNIVRPVREFHLQTFQRFTGHAACLSNFFDCLFQTAGASKAVLMARVQAGMPPMISSFGTNKQSLIVMQGQS